MKTSSLQSKRHGHYNDSIRETNGQVYPLSIPRIWILITTIIIILSFSFLFQLILVSVLNAFYDAVSQMLRKNVEKRALMDNLDGVLLAMDEIVDGG